MQGDYCYIIGKLATVNLAHFIGEYHDVFNGLVLYVFEMNSNQTIVLLLLGHK